MNYLLGGVFLERGLLLEAADAGDAATEEGLLLECNLDDMTPELIGLLTQRLLAAGAATLLRRGRRCS